MPFEKLVEELQPERDLGRLPLFQVWFVLQNAPRSAFQLSGIDITAMDVHNGTSKFDIGMFMVEKPEGLVANVEYSTEIFDDSTIQRMLGHFGVLLEAIAEDPSQRIGELPLLTEEERRQVVVEWNDTHRDYPRERSPASVHRSAGGAHARCAGAGLRVAATELSRAERARQSTGAPSAKAGSRTGDTGRRSAPSARSRWWLGLLGIMKAGGAYVPIDPDYPQAASGGDAGGR